MRLFIGNLPYKIGEPELAEHFTKRGYRVRYAQVMRNHVTQHSRGFGFVELETSKTQSEIIADMNQSNLGGRRVTVNNANPKQHEQVA